MILGFTKSVDAKTGKFFFDLPLFSILHTLVKIFSASLTLQMKIDKSVFYIIFV